MNASATPSDIDAAEAAMVEEHCVMLKRLADIGMALVEKLAADVEAGTAKGDPAASFEKLAQALRRTLALRAHFLASLKADKTKDGAAAPKVRRRPASKAEADVKAQVREGLHRAIEYQLWPCVEGLGFLNRTEDAEKLLEEFDDIGDYLTLPIDQTVRLICEEMGMDPDAWSWNGETWEMNVTDYEAYMGRGGERAPKGRDLPDAYVGGPDNPNYVTPAILNSG